MRHWDEWLVLVGKGDEEPARALLESPSADPAQPCQPSQLPGSEDEAEAAPEVEGFELDRHFWRDEDGVWMTDFPPPAGFSGDESDDYGDDYQRECSDEEQQLLNGVEKLDRDNARSEDERLRDEWLAVLRQELRVRRQKKAKDVAVPDTGPSR
jgi:hypothetical protein